jgi:hypothetical protein
VLGWPSAVCQAGRPGAASQAAAAAAAPAAVGPGSQDPTRKPLPARTFVETDRDRDARTGDHDAMALRSRDASAHQQIRV